ncbi:MAG TPA: hypothetical protein VGG39_23870 [Polyangiaceae bacterium]|jgi:hypothetical protein
MKSDVEEGAIRITQQFRSRDAMVYDLRGEAGRLTLRITGSRGEGEPTTEWLIEASTSTAADAVIVSERGATRAEVLQAVGRSWDRERATNHLPTFDWASVAKALAAVRAI